PGDRRARGVADRLAVAEVERAEGRLEPCDGGITDRAGAEVEPAQARDRADRARADGVDLAAAELEVVEGRVGGERHEGGVVEAVTAQVERAQRQGRDRVHATRGQLTDDGELERGKP